jgi:hypothetical protein
MIDVRLLLPAAALALLTACSPPPPRPVDQPRDDDPGPTRQHVVPSVESEIGALDAAKVQAVFDKAGPALKECYAQGVGRIGFLAGDIRLAVRVAEDGSTKQAYVKESTLGDRTTESCMLAVLKKQTWPKPVGGKEGTADSTFSFDPGDEERPPVEWAEGRMGDGFRKARSALARCRTDAGAGPMKATLYVDTEGKAMGAGVSGADAKSEDAARCVVDLLMGLKYASPGSYAAKVTVAIE